MRSDEREPGERGRSAAAGAQGPGHHARRAPAGHRALPGDRRAAPRPALPRRAGCARAPRRRSGTRRSADGPPHGWSSTTSHAVVLAADLGHPARPRRRARPGRRAVLAEHSGALVDRGRPGRAYWRAGAAGSPSCWRRPGTARGEVCGIGLAVPGPVDCGPGRVVQPPIMPGWDGYEYGGRLPGAFARAHARGRRRCPVLVDNDANLMAYGEQRTGHPDCSAFVLVKVSTGIGAGVVVDGRIYRGIDGGAGDIGHIRSARRPTHCACAAPTAASPPSPAAVPWPAARRTRASARRPARTCATCWPPGSPEAVALAREAGRRVGEVLVDRRDRCSTRAC